MDRGERRRLGKKRRIRMYKLIYSYFYPQWWPESPWQVLNSPGRHFMRDPGRWEHEMMIVPSRRKQNQMIKNGEYEGLFPDYKKPRHYYW